MNWTNLFLAAVAAMALSCGPTHFARIEHPVGPSLGSTATPATGSNGYLVVSSATETVEKGDSGTYELHTSYSVHKLDGALVQRVRNHDDDEDERPSRVRLPAGTYLVRARGRKGPVEVVVRIEPSRVTALHLDGGWRPPRGTTVRALAVGSDGVPIGWHARARSRLGLDEELRYEGSSTVAAFVHDAQSVFSGASVTIDVSGESAAGRLAALGTADLAGVAGPMESVPDDVECSKIGHDAIGIIVKADADAQKLTQQQVSDIFSGRVTNWSELGQPDGEIVPVLTSSGSATRWLLRNDLLHGGSYASSAITVQTDAQVVERVSKSVRFVGQVSVALLGDRKDVRALQIDGHPPSAADTRYPFRRPLHLCIRKDAPQGARDFVAWALSPEGQTVVAARFAPVRVTARP